jgi:uncharacterized membrane protein
MPVVLGLSLALNLAVLAAVGGAAWRHSGEERAGPRASKGGTLYIQALPPETRRAIREQMRSGPRPEQDAADMLAVLRQDPFDPAAAARVLDAQRDNGLQRRAAISEAWLSEITAMSAQERGAYADRMEQISKRGNGSWKERRKRE